MGRRNIINQLLMDTKLNATVEKGSSSTPFREKSQQNTIIDKKNVLECFSGLNRASSLVEFLPEF